MRVQQIHAHKVAITEGALGPVLRLVACCVQLQGAPAGEAAAAFLAGEVVELRAGPTWHLLAPGFGRQRELAGREVHEIQVREPRHGGLQDDSVHPIFTFRKRLSHSLLGLLVGAVDQEVVDHEPVLGCEQFLAFAAPESCSIGHILSSKGTGATVRTSVAALVADGFGGCGGGGGQGGSILMVLEEVVVQADEGLVTVLTLVLCRGMLGVQLRFVQGATLVERPLPPWGFLQNGIPL